MHNDLQACTFGAAPAAMYLVVLLNERADTKLTRKVSKFLANHRAALNDLVACHYETDELSSKTLGFMINLLEQNIRTTCKVTVQDEFIAHLLVNILIGEIRVFKRRLQDASFRFRRKQRETPPGVSVLAEKAYPAVDEMTEAERIELLRERSRNYLERKGKRNTLY